MNLLYDDFPTAVWLGGEERSIITDFKDWLRFYDMLRDPDLNDNEKFSLALQFYLEPSGLCVSWRPSEVLDPLIRFFRMDDAQPERETEDLGAEDESYQAAKPVFDYQYDAKYILAGFLHDYGIDLTRTQMHWWKFSALLSGLSEQTEFKQRVMYRSTDVGQIKDPKERQRILRIQRQIAIPGPKPSDFETGELFW